MKNMLIILVFVAATFAGCGSDMRHTFRDKNAFETGVARALDIPRAGVHCTKTDNTMAKCETGLGNTVYISCQSEDASGGHHCAWNVKP